MLNHAQLEPTVKTEPANTAHSNALLALVQPLLVLPAQMANTCSKENVSPSAQFLWLVVDAQISAHQDISLKSVAETASSVTTNARLVIMLLTDVLHVKQVLPATEPV